MLSVQHVFNESCHCYPVLVIQAQLQHCMAPCKGLFCWPDLTWGVLHLLQGELLLRCEELRDALWALCDAKHDAVEAACLKLAGDGSAAEQVTPMGTQLTSLVQVELDR
jgi:hypothetical protein